LTTLPTHSSNGLSSAAIGGIVGGILGILLLISVAITFYLLVHRNRAQTPVTIPLSSVGAEKKPEDVENLTGDLQTTEPAGGRLRYLDDQITEGGRLGASI
jgi:hypothetical protein